MSKPRRDNAGRFLPGQTGNPEGRLPRQTEAKYLEATMATVSLEDWAMVVRQALDDALNVDNPHIRARAREWLGKFLIGDTHELLYREERKFEITVTFGDNGDKALPMGDIIDAEPVLIDAN